MSTSPFMDDYSSEDYSDHDDDYCFVPTATSPPQDRAQVEIQTQSNELQNLIIDQQENVSESVYFDVLPELEAETAEEGGWMEQSIYLAVESYFDLEAQAETGHPAALETEIAVEVLNVESYCDLEAQAETGLPAALETETVLEEGDVIEPESLETVEADTVVEIVESMIEESIYEAVESESDLEAEDAIEEPNSDVQHEADAVAPQAETAVEEGDVIEESPETVAAVAALSPETAVEEDVIGESICEAVESDFDLEPETEDMVEEADDVVQEEAEDKVEEADDVVDSEEAEDMVGEEDDVVEEENMVGDEDDIVEEEEDMVEEVDDFVEEEDDMVEEEDTIDELLESDNNLQAEVEALVEEGDAMEQSIYEPLESNSDLQADEPEALAELAVSIEMTTFEAQEPDSGLEPEEPEDLIDEPSDSCEEESDLNEEEWDSDAEESDMDSSDSDLTEEEEDDVVVSYLNSSTAIQIKAWKNLVPASALTWAKLPVTGTKTLEDSSLLESFLECSSMLKLRECGNAVMNVIENLLCELLRIRNRLRRVLEPLFRKRETTKHA